VSYRLELVPLTFTQAAEWNAEHHRHHPDATGHKFSIGVATVPDGGLVGCAIVGRPVARHFDDGRTLEANRVCTDGYPNANSMLYGRRGAGCVRARIHAGRDVHGGERERLKPPGGGLEDRRRATGARELARVQREAPVDAVTARPRRCTADAVGGLVSETYIHTAARRCKPR
jgi:hypothetical protein